MLPQLGHPAQTTTTATGDDDFGIGEYESATQRRRAKALEALSVHLRRAHIQAHPMTPLHVWDLPWMRVYSTRDPHRRGYLEVRAERGGDWVCWRDSTPICDAADPEGAAEAIIEVLQ